MSRRVVDSETLIACVYKRPAVWDRRNKLHSSRGFVDNCWNDISTEMDIDETVLRKKWKYLRDQYAVEAGKMAQSRQGGDNQGGYTSKWQFTELLHFLQDNVKPRSSFAGHGKMAASSSSGHSDQSPAAQIELVKDEVVSSDTEVSLDPDPDSSQAFSDRWSSVQDKYVTAGVSAERKRRRNRSDDDHMDLLLDIEKKKLQYLLTKAQADQEEDNDLIFFRSLLPFVKRIPDHVKMAFRCRITEVVDEFAFPAHRQASSSRTAQS